MTTFKRSMIAPCGINCGVCSAHLRETNTCPGCRGDDSDKCVTRIKCRMKTCEAFQDGHAKYCFECGGFPCDALKHLDRRYRTRYRMSPIKNLEGIRDSGIREFLRSESAKWTCSGCGGTVCVHKGRCLSCGTPRKGLRSRVRPLE
jgi:hypothetical protein